MEKGNMVYTLKIQLAKGRHVIAKWNETNKLIAKVKFIDWW